MTRKSQPVSPTKPRTIPSHPGPSSSQYSAACHDAVQSQHLDKQHGTHDARAQRLPSSTCHSAPQKVVHRRWRRASAHGSTRVHPRVLPSPGHDIRLPRAGCCKPTADGGYPISIVGPCWHAGCCCAVACAERPPRTLAPSAGMWILHSAWSGDETQLNPQNWPSMAPLPSVCNCCPSLAPVAHAGAPHCHREDAHRGPTSSRETTRAIDRLKKRPKPGRFRSGSR